MSELSLKRMFLYTLITLATILASLPRLVFLFRCDQDSVQARVGLTVAVQVHPLSPGEVQL